MCKCNLVFKVWLYIFSTESVRIGIEMPFLTWIIKGQTFNVAPTLLNIEHDLKVCAFNSQVEAGKCREFIFLIIGSRLLTLNCIKHDFIVRIIYWWFTQFGWPLVKNQCKWYRSTDHPSTGSSAIVYWDQVEMVWILVCGNAVDSKEFLRISPQNV